MNKIAAASLPDPNRLFTARPARVEDARAIHAVFAAADLVDGTTMAGSWEEYKDELTRPDIILATDSQLVLSPGGGVVAAGWFIVNNTQEQERVASTVATVHPDYRRLGIGAWLLDWLETSTALKLAARPGSQAGWIFTLTREGLEGPETLFTRAGYQPVRRYYKMRCDLRPEIPQPGLPVDLTLIPYEAQRDSQVHALMDEAFKDHWMYQQHTPELWALHTSRSKDFCPQASFLVLADQVPVGAAVSSIWAEDNTRSGIQEGWVDMLGVLPVYRKRGIASAVLFACMHSFRRLGMDYAGLFVDAENESGALGLYEKLNFSRVSTSVRWRKRLR